LKASFFARPPVRQEGLLLMNARVVSGVLVMLGIVDLTVLNMVLVPRLASASTAITIEATPSCERVAPEPPAREAPGSRAVILAASIGAAPAAREVAPPAHAMPDIEFAFDGTGLEHLPAIHDLRRLARALRDNPGRRLLLRGHSDPLGFPLQNLALSERRAAAVRDYLVLRGAPADRIDVEGIGPNEPKDPLQTPGAWARDRRVEILWR
jgi:outer membrane protein OmpA-like peptidoglycan-associated protein